MTIPSIHSVLITYTRKSVKKKQKRTAKVINTIRNCYSDFLRGPCSQPSVLPEYQGVDLKDVQTESSLFEGVTFSELLA